MFLENIVFPSIVKVLFLLNTANNLHNFYDKYIIFFGILMYIYKT